MIVESACLTQYMLLGVLNMEAHNDRLAGVGSRWASQKVAIGMHHSMLSLALPQKSTVPALTKARHGKGSDAVKLMTVLQLLDCPGHGKQTSNGCSEKVTRASTHR